MHALYGLKSSGDNFREHLADCMRNLGYEPCLADPDLWLNLMARPDDHENYYSYILCYVDYILVLNHESISVLENLDGYFKLKYNSVCDPDIYLGSKLRNMDLENGVEAWGMSPSKYVKESVNNCKRYPKEQLNGKYNLPNRSENPFSCGYESGMDVSAPLDPSEASYFQSIIGFM